MYVFDFRGSLKVVWAAFSQLGRISILFRN